MKRVFLIRHGEPEAGWAEAEDPGLSALGREQAAQAAAALPAGLEIVSSPMLRCRQTAAAFEARLGRRARIEPAVSEVAAPAGTKDRRSWLAHNFPFAPGAGARAWTELDPALHAWRAEALEAIFSITNDSAVFTHFIAINAIVGAALARTETIVCRPGHCSITELALRDEGLFLIGLGAEARQSDVR